MVKMTIAGVTYEGSPQELKELLEKFGAKIPVEEEYRKVVGREPKVSDFVKFNRSYDGDVTVGKYYEITEIDGDGDAVFIDDGGSVNWAFRALFGEGEFEFFEKVAPGPKFEVGDYIVSLSAADGEYRYTNTSMKLGKVIEICDNGFIKIIVVRHENDLYEGQTFEVDPRLFRKAYKEEVDNAIFTKLGRKPGEFKKGDIVRVVNSPSASPIGTLAEVADVGVKLRTLYAKGWSSSLFRLVEYSYGFDDVELIAPVESRVDL